MLDAGGSAMFDDACKKALASCGFPPIAFGSYSKVLKVQGAARKAVGDANWTPKSGVDKQVDALPEAQQQFLANGQSGHMATNSMFQAPGGRGDPCSNQPGCAGYDANQAACTVHQGESTTPGSAHYQITQQEAGVAANQSTIPGATNPDGSMTPQGVSNCINATSQTAVQGSGAVDGKPGSDAEAQRLAGIRQNSADSQAGGQGAGASTAGGGAGDGAGAGGSNADPTKGPGGGSGLSADQKKAMECMEEYWKKQSEKARKDFTDKNRSTPAGSQEGKAGPPNPPDAATQAANAAQVKANQKQLDGMDADDPARKGLLAQNRALKGGCAGAQADYLSWYYDNNQTPPPMTPYPPGTTPGAPSGNPPM
jgi:hypothetical protein